MLLAPPDTALESLQTRIEPLYKKLAAHPLYRSCTRIEDLHLFMQSHVFAVWDFMSLLKALQRQLTCVDVPWLPSRTPESRHLVNEIVLGEESDVYQGMHASHFEFYRLAMQQCGASTSRVDNMISLLQQGSQVAFAMQQAGAPREAVAFVSDTFSLIDSGKTHVIASAFTFGREDLIPDMFKGLIREMNRELAGDLSTFLWYLDRHVEVDGEEHGPMALRMVSDVCGDDENKWAEAEHAAVFALESRLRLWDGIHCRIAAPR